MLFVDEEKDKSKLTHSGSSQTSTMTSIIIGSNNNNNKGNTGQGQGSLSTTSKNCAESFFGCCPDQITPAASKSYAGCPSVCQCNKVGSIQETCDPITGECQCKPGVGGLKCDRCLPGFWGLSRIVSESQPGCMLCDCSKFGSVREDCEQMTGRCVCKPNVLGHKCDSCKEGEFLGPYGCTSGIYKTLHIALYKTFTFTSK